MAGSRVGSAKLRYNKPRVYSKKISFQLFNIGSTARNALFAYQCVGGPCDGMDNICNCSSPACREWPSC